MFDQFVESGLKGLIDWVNWLDQWSNYADQLTEFYIMGVLVSNERTWETNAATTSTQSFKSSQVKGKDLHSPASWMKIFPKAFWQPHIWSVTPLRVHNIFNDMCNLLTKNHLEKNQCFSFFQLSDVVWSWNMLWLYYFTSKVDWWHHQLEISFLSAY